MKLTFPRGGAPALVAASFLLAGCSSDNSPGGNVSTAGSASGGKPGAGGSLGAGGSGAGGSSGSSAGGGAGLGTAGAGSVGAGGAAIAGSFAAVKGIIAKSCFGAICHDLNENPLKLKPEDTLYATLTSHVTKNCGKLVNTASPADSALVKILQQSCGTPPNTTQRMPYGACFDGDTPEDNSACIPLADVATIQAWIAKGAPPQ